MPEREEIDNNRTFNSKHPISHPHEQQEDDASRNCHADLAFLILDDLYQGIKVEEENPTENKVLPIFYCSITLPQKVLVRIFMPVRHGKI